VSARRGQAITELALIVPLLAFVLLAAVDVAGAVGAKMSLQAATAQADRIGALLGHGSSGDVDTGITNTVDQRMIDVVLGSHGIDPRNVQQIQIYKAAPDGSIATLSSGPAVDTYSTAPFTTATSYGWPLANRHSSEPSDSIAIHVKYRYAPTFSLPGLSSFLIDDQMVQRLNPISTDVPCPIPGIPINVTAAVTNASPTQPVQPPPSPLDAISWSPVPGATTYAVYANVDGAGFGSTPIYSGTISPNGGLLQYVYNRSGLGGNTAYAPTSYEVSGTNFCGEGERSLAVPDAQCVLPITPTIITTTQSLTAANTDVISWTTPFATAPISASYIITQQTSGTGPPVTTTVPIPGPRSLPANNGSPDDAPGSSPPTAPPPITGTATMTYTGSTAATYQMVEVNGCGVVGPPSNMEARPAPPPSSNELVGWWKFDEGTGATTQDSSPSQAHTGTLHNSPVGVNWTPGPTPPFSNAVSFSGTLGLGYISAIVSPTGTDLPAAATAQSISWWMQVSSAPVATQTVIALTNPVSNSGLLASIGFDRSSHLEVGMRKYGGGFLVAVPVISITAPTAWHHFVYTFDGTTTTHTHSLYVDGTLQASTTTTWGQSATPNNLEFGRSPSGPSGSEYYNGALDDVRIYTRALTAAEVSSLDSQP